MIKRALKRNRSRSIGLSDEVVQEIKIVTSDCSSISSFVRMAVIKELERLKFEKGGKDV